jgi:hypothetical protein
VPDSDGEWVWVTKEDGGSDEGMTKKVGGQHVEDTDNSFKSEFTNAFRRACQDAWGVGRYLYGEGVPLWLDPSIPTEAIYGQPEPSGTRRPRAEYDDAPAPPIVTRDPAPQPQSQERANVAAPTPAERIDIPATGRDVYAWARVMEQRFRTKILGGMQQGAERRGLDPRRMYNWPQLAVNEICLEAITFLKGLANYRGEFDHIVPHAPAPHRPEVTARLDAAIQGKRANARYRQNG